jgi:CDP-2,3-bis-(O-geranylgeranyl)-sn-glycerol synthase
MIDLFLQSFYFSLPAYLANMSPVILNKLGAWKYFAKPIDGGRKIGNQFIFGKNKTWRGLLSAIVFGSLMAMIQAFLYRYEFFRELSIVDYTSLFLIFGILAGSGAILGDLVKSFFKRRIGIVSGQAWPIFDQLDFIFGFILFVYYFSIPSVEIIITICLITLVLHPLTNMISYLLGVKKVWW